MNEKYPHLVKLVNAYDSSVSQHHGSALHDEPAGVGVPEHRGRQTGCTAAFTRGVDLDTESELSIRGSI